MENSMSGTLSKHTRGIIFSKSRRSELTYQKKGRRVKSAKFPGHSFLLVHIVILFVEC